MNHPTLSQTMMNMLAFHDGQTDKSGMPYFQHPARVMFRLGPDATDAERHVALLHDVIEDCGVTREILFDLGYSEEVLDMVQLLTRDKSMNYRQFIYNVVGSGNIGAMRIKLADLYDNSSEARLRLAPPEVRHEVEQMIAVRYKPAISMLLQCLGEHARGVIPDDLDIEIKINGENNGTQDDSAGA